MQFTLKMVKDEIAGQAHAYGFGVADATSVVNRAIRALSHMSGWKCLRRTYRFSTDSSEFALPQGCANLVRVCVNGRPASLRGTDFTFIQSGIGVPPPGYREIPVRNVLDAGVSPFFERPPASFQLAAVTDGESASTAAQLRVTYVDGSGVKSDTLLPILHTADTGAATETAYLEGSLASPVFTCVRSVAIVGEAPSHIRVYAKDASGHSLLATYHKSVPVPTFRWYRVPGVPPGTPLDILAEVRIDPLPLVDDSDVVPFDSIEPIEWMVRAEWESRSGEVDRAEKYRNMAGTWLTQQEQTEETVQAPLIVNTLFDGSPGEISEDSWNI